MKRPHWRLTAMLRLAAALVSLAVTVEMPRAEPAAIVPSTGIGHADDRLTVEVRGTGPDVILIPGLATGRDVWEEQVKRLEGRYRLHLVQLSGFGGQPAGANSTGPILAPAVDALERYIAANGLRQPAVIGHSMGGLLALLLSEKCPSCLGRLMLVDTLPFLPALQDATATPASMTPLAAGMRDRIIAQSDADFAKAEQQTVARLVKNPDRRANVAGWAMASDRSVVARSMYDVMTTDTRPLLANLRVPLTVIYAAASPRAAETYAAAYATVAKHRLVGIDDAYHFIMLDQPDAFADALSRFLGG